MAHSTGPPDSPPLLHTSPSFNFPLAQKRTTVRSQSASWPAARPAGCPDQAFFIILSHPSPPSQRWQSAKLRTFPVPAVVFTGLHPLLALCYAPRRAAARALRLTRCDCADLLGQALVTPGDVGTTQADAARICTSDCCAAAPAATAWHVRCHAPLRNLCLPSEIHWRTLACTYTYASYLIYAPIHDRMEQRGEV